MESGNHLLTIRAECPEIYSASDLILVAASLFNLNGKLAYLISRDTLENKSLYLRSMPEAVIKVELGAGRPSYRIGLDASNQGYLNWEKALIYNLIPSQSDQKRKLITYPNILIRTLFGGS